VLQPFAETGAPAFRTLVALDSVGAGVGEHVFFVRGREAAFPFYPAEPPTDASVVGIVDRWDIG
jgi:microcompartment protein CcmK/EutM